MILFSTFWFWLILIELILLLWCEAYENSIAPLFCLAIGLGVYWYFDSLPSLETIKNNSGNILIAILIYACTGVIWSFIKWISFLYDKKDEMLELDKKIKNAYAEYLIKHNVAAEDFTFEDYIENQTRSSRFCISWNKDYRLPPNAGDYKTRIIHWICYWPLSALWFAMSDLVKKIGTAIYRVFSGWYQQLADKIFYIND